MKRVFRNEDELEEYIMRRTLIFMIILFFGGLLGLLFVKVFFNTNLNDMTDINNYYSFIGLIPGVVYGILNIISYKKELVKIRRGDLNVMDM